jgi:hypothetical protein
LFSFLWFLSIDLMSWVLIYIGTNFLAPIPCISLGIIESFFKFLPKSTNFSNSIPNRLKPVCTPEIARLNQEIRPQKSPIRKKPVSNRLKPAHRLKLAQDRLKPAYPAVNAIHPHRPPHPWPSSPSTARSLCAPTSRFRQASCQLAPTTPHSATQRQPSHLMLHSIPSLDHAATAQNPLAPTSAALAQLPPDQLRTHK